LVLSRAAPSRTLTLGKYPALSVDAARELAKAAIGQVATGADPAASRAEAKRRRNSTLSAVLDRYEASQKQRKAVKVATALSALRRGLSVFSARDVAELTRAELYFWQSIAQGVDSM
jgi:hypothetical protein